jgi:hypothetical protein
MLFNSVVLLLVFLEALVESGSDVVHEAVVHVMIIVEMVTFLFIGLLEFGVVCFEAARHCLLDSVHKVILN